MAPTIVVLGVCWTACKDYCRAAPHVASRERCAAPRVARGERCAAPHVVRGDQRAGLDAGSYRTLRERLALQRLVLERLVLERLVMAAPEPRHLTSLASWSAPQNPTRRLGREG